MVDDKKIIDSSAYGQSQPPANGRIPGWIKIGAVAAASVLAGGLAATWYYRKTLAHLRQAEQGMEHSNSGRIEEGTEDENWHI